MDTKLLEFALVLLLVFALFTIAFGAPKYSPIVYSRDQVIVLCNTAAKPGDRLIYSVS